MFPNLQELSDAAAAAVPLHAGAMFPRLLAAAAIGTVLSLRPSPR